MVYKKNMRRYCSLLVKLQIICLCLLKIKIVFGGTDISIVIQGEGNTNLPLPVLPVALLHTTSLSGRLMKETIYVSLCYYARCQYFGFSWQIHLILYTPPPSRIILILSLGSAGNKL